MADLAVNHLRRDHQEIRRFLAQLVSLLDSLSRAPEWTPEHGEAFQTLARFFETDLCLFIRKEDQILYPALQGLFPLEAGPLAVLRGEHRDFCLNFQKLCELGRILGDAEGVAAALDEFVRLGRRAAEILDDHLYKEERVLFPMAARYLTPERDAELLAQMEALDGAHPPKESQ